MQRRCQDLFQGVNKRVACLSDRFSPSVAGTGEEPVLRKGEAGGMNVEFIFLNYFFRIVFYYGETYDF